MRAASGRLRSLNIVVLALACLLGASGCAASPPPKATPSATAVTPAFASDEEALAAAEKAYQAYLDVDSAVMKDGGIGAARFESVAVGQALQESKAGAADVEAAGIRTIGMLTYEIKQLQSAHYANPAEIDVTFYVCEDLSTVQTVDDSGNSVVAVDGTAVTPWQITVAGSVERLVVSGRSFWTGVTFCR